MMTNNLIIKLKDRSAQEIAKVRNLLLSMQGKIPALLSIRVETDARGPEKAAYDLMLITRFNSLEDFQSYLDHPLHLEVAAYIQEARDSGASLLFREN
jgi:hypothetical protein